MLASSRMTGCNGGTQRTIYVSLRRDEGIPPYKYDLCAACSAKAAGTQCAPLRSLQSKNMCSSLMNQILLMFVKDFFLKVAQKKGRTKRTHQIAGFETMM